MDGAKIKIVLINHSDTAGGSSVVTRRLMDALCNIGADARMLVVHKNSQSPRVETAAHAKKARFFFLAEHALIYTYNGRRRDTLFRISLGRPGLPLHRNHLVRQADVVIINWINQGMLSLKEIKRIAEEKTVIWTMHDQWNMTGVCHYTDGCNHWLTQECRNCPLLPRRQTAHKVYKAKQRLYKSANIHFVAVSNRLAELCRQSPLMKDLPISVIPNAFPIEQFPVAPALSRSEIGIPETGRIITMGAARLDDHVKNLPLAIEILNSQQPSLDAHVVFFGAMRDPDLLDNLRVPYTWLGAIDNHDALQSLYAHSDIVLSTSLWETLPGTIIEGVSCGAYAVATDNGGQADIITDPTIGILLPNSALCSPHSELYTLNSALCSPHSALPDREARHRAMAARFSGQTVARAYMRLIDTLRH